MDRSISHILYHVVQTLGFTMLKNFFKSKNKIGLLPYIREEAYGFSPDSNQHIGWELSTFNIPSMWKSTNGKGVKIAVIDTGCDIEHEDLKGNIIYGMNFIDKNQPPIDKNGHGTHVAGTIAATNNGKGMVGVAPEAKIMPIKSLKDDGNGEIQDIVNGIKWAADHKADFITMSLGSPYPHKQLEQALVYATSKGCVCFCAAGNSGPSTDIMYPAKYENTISIGAIDKHLQRTRFTCSGDSLDFLAPGQDIFSCVPNNQYAVMSGTSMSNPFAVGCAALLLSWNRTHNKYKLNNAEDYVNVFKKHTIRIPNEAYALRKYQGYGILSLEGIIE